MECRVSEYRKKKGLTQEQLAEAVNITPIMVSNIETGHKKMSMNSMERIAKALDVEPFMLIMPSKYDKFFG